MKSLFKLSVTAIVALALAGCVTSGPPGSFGSFTTGLGVALGNALKPANINKSIRNVAKWGDAVACAVQTGTGVAQKIEQKVKAGDAAQTTTGLIYTISELACAGLGGTPTAVVPAATVRIVVQQ